MNELAVHPSIYATGRNKGLVQILERVWLRDHTMGDGTLYVVSGFANYNGGVRFFPVFRRHVEKGGNVVAIFSGSTRQHLTSRQVVREMLECGAEVHVVNRKRLMHAKSYGSKTSAGEMLVVTSGNFTGPGMAQNVEMSLLLDRPTTSSLGFSWNDFISNMLEQPWNLHKPTLNDMTTPAWQLLYDEQASTITLDETDEVTMILLLGHADTIRINASLGTKESRGTQYFWLSKDCYDFFQPLTIPNTRGYKQTYSCMIRVNFGRHWDTEADVRDTFEAENNLDFRLGTGPLRYTNTARRGGLGCNLAHERNITMNYAYTVRIQKFGAHLKLTLFHFIGHQGKRYGFISNQEFEDARRGITRLYPP